MYRRIDPQEIVRTLERLAQRVEERFPGSSLSRVVAELLVVAQEATQRAQRNRRPILALRGLLVLLLGVIGVSLIELPLQLRLGEVDSVAGLVQVLEPSISIAFFLSALAIYLLSLETGIKRGRTLQALHELRAIAHVVDMHQLTKDPATLLEGGASTLSSPQRTMTDFELIRYLDYCSEILALISKIAALYVQDFPDAGAIASVDEVENLTSGLSRKIWQKLTIVQAERGPAQRPVPPREAPRISAPD
jgi:hypothetical protein